MDAGWLPDGRRYHVRMPDLKPFVLPVESVTPDRRGTVDLYLPDSGQPSPAVVFVHGLLTSDTPVSPRDWPVYQGYGSLAARNGLVGVMFDHRLADLAAIPDAANDLAEAVEAARSDPRVDPDRIALWIFSGGGLLLADWLRKPPGWLRCVAASYPLLGAPGYDLDPRLQPSDAVASAGDLPIVLTRVGLERPPIAQTVEAFLTAAQAAGARLEIIDVPNGHHGFDALDDTDESRDAIRRAMAAVVAALDVPGADQ
jgi:acetyl esterase/lipase